jgi:hypothetical protein
VNQQGMMWDAYRVTLAQEQVSVRQIDAKIIALKL